MAKPLLGHLPRSHAQRTILYARYCGKRHVRYYLIQPGTNYKGGWASRQDNTQDLGIGIKAEGQLLRLDEYKSWACKVWVWEHHSFSGVVLGLPDSGGQPIPDSPGPGLRL